MKLRREDILQAIRQPCSSACDEAEYLSSDISLRVMIYFSITRFFPHLVLDLSQVSPEKKKTLLEFVEGLICNHASGCGL